MDSILQTYLERNNSKDEFEIRFGETITKMNYNNVIQWLLLSGFNLVNPDGVDLLRISIDSVKSRIELTGFDAVQTLCRENTLLRPLYTTKTNINNFDGKRKEYGVRMSLSNEDPASIEVIDEITKTWLTSMKTFRYMNRVQLVKEGVPFKVDCSVVRMVRNRNASTLFTSELTYEIEAEFINEHRGKTMKQSIVQIITYILRGFQRTYFPLPYTRLDEVREEYIQMTGTRNVPFKKSRFIGPNLVTLQLENVYTTDDPNHVSIQQDFTVTDKADGERKFLMITKDGEVFLITSGLSVEYTGCKTELRSVLIDGEHIEYDKYGNYINTYMCFDLYYYQDKKKLKDVRPESFIDVRLPKLQSLILHLNLPVSHQESFKVDVKTFYYKLERDTRSIFDLCKLILDKQDDFLYKTDGLIFTPTNYGVGLSKNDRVVKNYRDTWALNFKWKPVEDNTIDFYIHLKDFVQGTLYRTILLYVGYSKDDIMASPCSSVFNANELGVFNKEDNKILFRATEPFDEQSHICNMDTPTGILRTEHGEIIEDGMVIEFKYDKDAKHGWNWKPLRVRWDKMKQTITDGKSVAIRTPNSYTTAISNWYTIHNPITNTMIKTGFYDDKKENPIVDITYYNENKTSYMKEFRDFHNRIKSRLIGIHPSGQTVSIGRNLIDFACGKAGDLQKWKESKFSFVLGIDINADNLNNKKDGACTRYISTFDKGYKTRCLFIRGNSSLNVRSGEAMFSVPDKLVCQSIFGTIPKNPVLGKGVMDHYGKGEHGFDIASIQFAVHYMFESKETLESFIHNISQCTKLNGYFVGTCFDGERVLNKINPTGEYVSYDDDKNMICSIKRDPKEGREKLTMNDCMGYTIQVNQSTIGKPIDEYLVYFPYFIQEMEKHGFKIVDPNVLEGFSHGIGSFEQLYTNEKLNAGQKNISFLNNYFIFKKEKEMSMIVKKLGTITI